MKILLRNKGGITISILLLMFSTDVLSQTVAAVPQPWDYIFYTFACCSVVFASFVILAYKEYRWFYYVLLSALLVIHAASMDGTLAYFVLTSFHLENEGFVLWVVPFLLTTSIACYGHLLTAMQIESTHRLAKLKQVFIVMGIAAGVLTCSAFYWLGSLSLAEMWVPANILFFTMVISQFLPPLTWLNYDPKLRFFIRMYPIIIAVCLTVGFSYLFLNDASQKAFNAFYRVILLLVASFSLIIVIWQAFHSRHRKEIAEKQTAIAAKKEAETKLELMKAEQAYNDALSAATKHRSQLVAVSHDLKQPVTALRSAVERLTMGKGVNAENLILAIDYIDSLSRNYVSQHNESVHLGEVKSKEKEKVSTTMLMGVLRKMFADEAKERNILIRFYSAEYQVLIEPLSTMRIMTNLINNALTHSNGSKMLVGFRSKGQQLIFQVHDNGLGVSRVMQPNMLLNGWKGDESSGEGLGLSIVSEQCKAQAMEFKLESTEGKGTSVFVVMQKAAN